MSDQSNYYSLLAPFIKEFIYRNGWTELRDIQEKSCEYIFTGEDNILISAGTASGKTEAALFPILTLINQKPVDSISVLYVAPLKALINDQFKRLEELCAENHISITKWHGDVSQSKKKKVLSCSGDILQITPESLESLFIHHYEDIKRIFSSLQFIILDEIHVFMETTRGLHALTNIIKLEKEANVNVRRIGLSATLSDCDNACRWLSTGSKRNTISIKEQNTKRKIRLYAEQFYFTRVDDHFENQKFFEFLYENSLYTKSIIFTNTRGEAEEIIYRLKEIAKKKNTDDIYFVHHGSVAKDYRYFIEERLKSDDRPMVIAATLTLELGIDIGSLEKVFQINASYTVSSFVQRLGRSGRKYNNSEMCFVCNAFYNEYATHALDNFAWDLVQVIAIVQLYLEERWVESFENRKYPLSLLYQQTLSAIIARSGMDKKEMIDYIKSLYVFAAIKDKELENFIDHLISLNHLIQLDNQELIIGNEAERIVNKFEFYSMIPDIEEYTVLFDGKELGKVNLLPQLYGYLSLNGMSWKVKEIDLTRKKIYVDVAKDVIKKLWDGKSGDIDTKILSRMKQVLSESMGYPYLGDTAQNTIQMARNSYFELGMDKSNLVCMSDNSFIYIPWIGSKQLRTLTSLLGFKEIREILSIVSVAYHNRYSITIQTIYGQDFEKALYQLIISKKYNHEFYLNNIDFPEENEKYDKFIYPDLLKKAYVYDQLDIDGLTQWAKKELDKIYGY